MKWVLLRSERSVASWLVFHPRERYRGRGDLPASMGCRDAEEAVVGVLFDDLLFCNLGDYDAGAGERDEHRQGGKDK